MTAPVKIQFECEMSLHVHAYSSAYMLVGVCIHICAGIYITCMCVHLCMYTGDMALVSMHVCVCV